MNSHCALGRIPSRKDPWSVNWLKIALGAGAWQLNRGPPPRPGQPQAAQQKEPSVYPCDGQDWRGGLVGVCLICKAWQKEGARGEACGHQSKRQSGHTPALLLLLLSVIICLLQACICSWEIQANLWPPHTLKHSPPPHLWSLYTLIHYPHTHIQVRKK